MANTKRSPTPVMPSLLSVNVGMPKDVAWQGKTVRTGIWKTPVTGPQMARRLNIDGDGQGDLAGHGGEQRAVLVYQAESYRILVPTPRPRPKRRRLRIRLLRRELHRGGTARQRGVRRRPVPHRPGRVRGHPTASDLLPGRHAPGHTGPAVLARRAPPPRFLPASHRRRPGAGRRSDHPDPARTARTDHRRDRRAALPAEPGPGETRISPGYSGVEPRLAAILSRPSRREAGATSDGAPSWSGFGRCASTRSSPKAPPSPPSTSPRRTRPRCRPPGPASTSPCASRKRVTRRRSAATRSPRPPEPTDIGSASNAKARSAATSTRNCKSEPASKPRRRAGNSCSRPASSRSCSISAGVGVTPVLAMLHELAAEHTKREVWWLHSARNADSRPSRRRRTDCCPELASAHVHVFHTAPDTRADAPSPPVTHSRLTPKALAGLHLPPAASAYICGPEQFMADMTKALTDIGLESPPCTPLFGASAPINPGLTPTTRTPPHPPRGEPGTGPSVTFARSGLTTPWNTATASSLLEFAESCDVPARWSCRTGVCHTCVTQLLTGEIVYRPEPLDLRPPAMCWSAAHARPPISSSTCDATGPPRTGCAIAGTPAPPAQRAFRYSAPHRAVRSTDHDGSAPLYCEQ